MRPFIRLCFFLSLPKLFFCVLSLSSLEPFFQCGTLCCALALPLHFSAKVRLSPSRTLPLHNLVIWTNGSFPFLFGEGSSCVFIRLEYVPDYSFLPGNDTPSEFARRGALFQLSTIPCSRFSPLLSTHPLSD